MVTRGFLGGAGKKGGSGYKGAQGIFLVDLCCVLTVVSSGHTMHTLQNCIELNTHICTPANEDM